MVLQAGRDGCHPGVDAGISLVVLVDVVEGKADELTIDNGFRAVEGVAVGIYAADECGTAVLDAVVEFTHTANEGVAVRRAVAAAEDGDGLAVEVAGLERAQPVVPVVLQLTCAPCRGAQYKVFVGTYDISRQVLYIQGFAAQFRGNLLRDGLTGSRRGTIDYNCFTHYLFI